MSSKHAHAPLHHRGCRYPHPKQVLVTDGVLSPDLAAFMAGGTKRKPDAVARYGSSKVGGAR